MISGLPTRYFNALKNNINERFPIEVLNVLETFNILNPIPHGRGGADSAPAPLVFQRYLNLRNFFSSETTL